MSHILPTLPTPALYLFQLVLRVLFARSKITRIDLGINLYP